VRVSFITYILSMSKKLLALSLVLVCSMALSACNKTEVAPTENGDAMMEGTMETGTTATGDAMAQ
jgi:hypothetical protein